MCGRFVSSSPPDELAKYFDVEAVAESVLEPSFNVAPSQDVYVVVETGGLRRLDTFHWGLVPFWAKDPSTGNKMINARVESIAGKSAYRRSFQKRRCIIPADGFYEWKKVPGQKAKQPYFIHRVDGEPMAFAGLWEVWRPRSARAIRCEVARSSPARRTRRSPRSTIECR
jgi:putative SOS response-associated peptidase YedK